MFDSKLKQTLYNAVKYLPLPERERGQLRIKLDQEIKTIEAKKLAKMFKERPGERVPLEVVVQNPDVSIVGFLTHSLIYGEREEISIDSVTHFMQRLEQVKKFKGGTIQEEQIIALISYGMFGKPQEAYKEYYEYVHPGAEIPVRRFGKKSAVGVTPKITIEMAKELTDMPVATLGEFLHPSSARRKMHMVGWLKEKPKVITTRQKKDMAFVNFFSVDDTEKTDDSKVDCVIFPDDYADFKDVIEGLSRSDLVSVIGERTYNRDRKAKQLQIRSGDRIKVVELPEEM